MSDTISSKLSQIQSELVAPKNQFNKFGNYKYRSCEDIVEAVKPLLKKHELVLLISDEIIEVGGRVYVKATATIKDSENSLFVTASARETDTRKGMDDAQVTGSASSYARKYALNGLFAIDDTKDSDATNKHGKEEDKKEEDTQPANPAYLNLDQQMYKINSSENIFELNARIKKYAPDLKSLPLEGANKVKAEASRVAKILKEKEASK